MGAYIETKKKAAYIAELILEKKGEDVVVLDIGKVSGFCDYFVIASGESTRRVQAISENIIEGLHKQGMRVRPAEGKKEGTWILIDSGDIIAHIFYKETRKFYDIERLWHDAPREEIKEKCS